MVRVNLKENEITVKIVYYGPGLAGKTTNLQSLHSLSSQLTTTELFSVKTKEDRTLFFDLMPFDFKIDKRTIKFKIYTVPGQIQYESTRKIVLAGADAIVFVADSSKSMEKQNIESFEDLKLNLMKNKIDINKTPLVIQYNKRDLKNIFTVNQLNEKLNKNNYKYFESIAVENIGVLETFESIVKRTINTVFPAYKITKNIWEIEKIIDEVESTLKPLYLNKSKTISTQDTTGLVYDNVDVDEKLSDNLLENAIKATDEAASLYSEIKVLKSKLEKKNLQLNSLLKENKYIRQFLESVFSQSGVPIAVCNFTGKVVNWNREMYEITGISQQDSKNIHMGEIFSDKSRLEFLKHIENIRKSEKPLIGKLEIKTANSSIKPFEVTISPLKNLKNEVIAFSFFLSVNKNINISNTINISVGKVNGIINSLNEKLTFVSEQLCKDAKLKVLGELITKAIGNVSDISNELNSCEEFSKGESDLSKHIEIKDEKRVRRNQLDNLIINKKILIASDSKILINNTREILQSSILTESIEKSELVRHLNVDKYNFIFYDYHFPGLNGKQLFQWIYYEKPQILNTLVLMIPPGFSNEVYNFIEDNEINYIVKPLTEEKILNSLNKVLAGF